MVAPEKGLVPVVFGASLFFLAGLGLLSGVAGGASMLKAAARVAFWGMLAMGLTAVVGSLFGTIV